MAHAPHDHDPAPDTNAQAAFETFIATVVGALVRGVRPPELFGLADTLVPEVAAAMPPLAAQPIPTQQAAARMLAHDIAARTPLPERRFAQRPLPEPGRNEPCDCGSGRKYKQCCQSAPRTRALEGVNLLPWVLDALPRSAGASWPAARSTPWPWPMPPPPGARPAACARPKPCSNPGSAPAPP